MIKSYRIECKPALGRAVGLGVAHVDIPSISLVFHYTELVWVGSEWHTEMRQEALVPGVHFEVNGVLGTITLIAHPFWQQEGRWRTADLVEPLLYKGQVKHPHYIEASFDYYAPAQVTITTDKASIVGNGADPLTLTASAEDGSSPVPVAVYNGDGTKFATIQITGSKVIRATVPGIYRLEADRDMLDPTWNLPLYAPALENGSVTVEVISA